MINRSSNLNKEQLNQKLDVLWKGYSNIFNNIDHENIELQNKKLEELLIQIRKTNQLIKDIK